ncbi:hypothetical protein [Methylobacterium oxalidis]|uniref:Uncharacterized protein n=1 Tax=Methylobacterium oxalidis TaxID=944322 RepID=A0A512J251_9HYPH|nr:hypothetical protein [Methylobacterium oxalidis]GEP04034.1 hypothetical protein MOX02_20720 [Methylobacterium oxalidis]GJE34841.1 hypothetical protein LDDCCGHA_5056 [Methylobacterium oxalidis]GLS64065.1 hypothetical protein GCM10007888_24460 [Methylobacterium oxalidis]
MDTNTETVATWAYQPDGAARIFDLAPGEGLPEGWHASPDCITDPALATADALSARLQGREYVPTHAEADPATDAPAGALEAAVAEIERLKAIIEAGAAENERLVAEIDAAEVELEKAAAALVALKADLDKAQADGGFAVSERDDAKAALDALKAELDQTRADLEAATAPAAPAKPAKAR